MKLRIDKPIYGGAGLARISEGEQTGKAVFVPFTLPGETVEAELRSGHKGFAEAELIQVMEAAPERVAPHCRHFGPCGGCQYQHAAYDAQLRMKETILLETLQRAGIHDAPKVQVHAAEPWEYRNRVRFRVEGSQVGYNRRGSHAFLPIEECPITAPLLLRAAKTVMAQKPEIAELELFCDSEQKQLQMMLLAKKSAPAEKLRQLCEAVKTQIPELIGAGWAVISSDKRGGDAREVSSWEEASLRYQIGEEVHAVRRGAFFQVNRFLVEELVGIVLAGRQGKTAWDLYAGVGLFSAELIKRFESVTAVEIGEVSMRSLTERMRQAGGKHQAVRATTANFLSRIKGAAPDLVVADPPRAGLGKDVVERLTAIGPETLVYVSCDPSTLSRDLAGLLQSGYTFAELHLVDLFPQTFHMETVAVLHR